MDDEPLHMLALLGTPEGELLASPLRMFRILQEEEEQEAARRDSTADASPLPDAGAPQDGAAPAGPARAADARDPGSAAR